MKKVMLALTAIAIAGSPGRSAAQGRVEDFPVDAATRARVVAGISEKLGAGYFDAARAEFIKAQLARKSVRASYDTCTTAASLSAAISQDLQSWSHDRHLRVLFSVQPLPKPAAEATSGLDQDEETSRSRNFGFFALTRFTGNIGYLEIGRFDDAARAGATLQAAMQFLANTDALIIDLRQNGGGHVDMVALMTSYFLKDQKLLLTLQHRAPRQSDQVWSTAYVPGPRYLDKPIFILTSGRTFSGAEGLTYDLKYFANATVVGEKTRGGANPGSIQQIDEHFAVVVPNAQVVHAATGSNWDANGIAPDVAVAAKDASRTALKLALERLIKEQPASPRFKMWKEAYDDMFPAPKN